MPLFAATASLSAALSPAAALGPDRLSRLLARLLARLHTPSPFPPEERDRLADLLSLPPDTLAALLSAASYVFEQAAYHAVRPETLRTELEEAGVEAAAAEVFGAVWGQLGRTYLEQLRERGLGGPAVLTDVHWALSMDLASSRTAHTPAPHALTALLELEVAGPGRGGREVVHVGLGAGELLGLLDSLAKIQAQLDALA